MIAAVDTDTSAGPIRPWGYWATFGWAVLAFLAGQLIALFVMLLWRAGDLNALLATQFDGIVVTVFILISNPVMIGLLMVAVLLTGIRQADYFALRWPRAADVAIGLALLVALIAVTDLLLYLGGHDLVTTFQLQSYGTAATEGWLAPLLVAAIIIAPFGEEITFRGFLFRGWARSPRSTWPAIIAISILWSALHVQYDWTGVLQIFVAGLVLGFMRARSGSTLLTFFLHALFNVEGTLETVLRVHFFS